MTTRMTCEEGAGAELAAMLRDKLQIPEGVIQFSVHFDGEAVRVKCEYYPEEPEACEIAYAAAEKDRAWRECHGVDEPEPAPDPVALHNARKLA